MRRASCRATSTACGLSHKQDLRSGCDAMVFNQPADVLLVALEPDHSQSARVGWLTSA